MITGVEYSQAEKAFASDTSVWYQTDLFLRESNDTVFAFKDGMESIWLINNLYLDQEYTHAGYCDLTVISKDTISKPPLNYIIYDLHSPYDLKSSTQVNMVGFKKGMFTELCTIDGAVDKLLCFQRSNSIIYKYNTDHPCVLPDSIPTSVNDVPHKNLDNECGLWNFSYILSPGEIFELQHSPDRIWIYSLSGKLIEFQDRPESIAVEDLGIYFVKIQYDTAEPKLGLIFIR